MLEEQNWSSISERVQEIKGWVSRLLPVSKRPLHLSIGQYLSRLPIFRL